jgi:hypothetical protein
MLASRCDARIGWSLRMMRQRTMQTRNALTAALCVFFACGTVNDVFAAGAMFLQDTAHAALTEEDKKLQHDNAISVLNGEDANGSKEWSNPKTRSSGRSQSLGNLKSEDGLHCRRLRLYTNAKGVESQLTFPVCKNVGGDWFIASGMKLTKA